MIKKALVPSRKVPDCDRETLELDQPEPLILPLFESKLRLLNAFSLDMNVPPELLEYDNRESRNWSEPVAKLRFKTEF